MWVNIYILLHILETVAFKIISLFMNAKKVKGDILFNDALNTFYLRLYGLIHNYAYRTLVNKPSAVLNSNIALCVSQTCK